MIDFVANFRQINVITKNTSLWHKEIKEKILQVNKL